MAGFTFLLKDPQTGIKKEKNQKSTPILLVIKFNRKRIRIYTGQSLKPIKWNQEKQQATGIAIAPELNGKLTSIKNTAQRVYNRFVAEHQEQPAPGILKDLIEVEAGLKEQTDTKISFFQHYQNFIAGKKIEYCLKRGIEQTDSLTYRDSSITNYKRSYDLLKEFSATYRVDFDTINSTFKNRYYTFLTKKKGFGPNSIVKMFKLFRAVMNDAISEGITTNLTYKKFKFQHVETPFMYLNETELELLAGLELKPYQSRIRDLFLISAWTGLRFSDYSRLTAQNVDYDRELITIKMQKTKAPVKIPFLPEVAPIFQKYKETEIPTYANQVVNRELKKIGIRLAEAVKESQYTLEPKEYSKLSTHDGRRSFCSNMYKRGLQPSEIMPISGHRTEREFLKYIRISSNEQAEKFKAAATRQSATKHLKAV